MAVVVQRPEPMILQQDGDGAPVEFGDHRGEDRVAEVGAVVVGDDDEALGVQFLQGPADLGDGAVRFAEREVGEQAEAVRVVGGP
ncbi:hypothetical protein ACQEU6_37055 [Spirillospora sp. CA-108201]